MRVTHVSPKGFGADGIVGGGERYPHELATAMARKCPTRLVTFGPRSARRQEGPLDIVTLRTVGHWKGNEVNPVSLRLLRPYLDADVIHVHQWESTVANEVILLGRALGKRVFVTDHGGGGINYWRRLRLDRLVNGFLSVSKHSASYYPELVDRTTVILGGVDTQRFSPARHPRERQALFVGRLLPHKGIDTLVRAITDQTPLVVVGRPYDPMFRDQLHALARNKPIRFEEQMDDQSLVREYQRSRVSVLPTVSRGPDGTALRKHELLGLALLEAMSCATPVICSDVGGMPELVDDGVNGYVVPPGDVGELRKRLELLLEVGPEWEAMSAAALRLAQANSWDQVADRCLALYAS